MDLNNELNIDQNQTLNLKTWMKTRVHSDLILCHVVITEVGGHLTK